MENAKIDERKVSVKNVEALQLNRGAGREKKKKKLTSIVFNRKMIVFMKNEKGFELGNIGIVRY